QQIAAHVGPEAEGGHQQQWGQEKQAQPGYRRQVEQPERGAAVVHGAAFTSVHILVQASRSSAVMLGVKFVFCRIVGSLTAKVSASVGWVMLFITFWFEWP